MSKFLIITGLLFILGTFTACNAEQDQDDINELSDDRITEAVKVDLLVTRGIDTERITAATMDGIVTLSGVADNLLTKERASRVASTIKGVRSVVNNISVVSDREDSATKHDIEAALAADPATEKWEIVVSVDDGYTMLTGSVDSWQEKELAGTVAKGVDGVTAISNDITVDYSSDRSDQTIKMEVISALDWNTKVDNAFITVEVNNGSVDLSGSVASLYEKNKATSLAYLAGVSDVDATGLEIDPWMNDALERDNFLADKSDTDIEKAINDAFIVHPRINADLLEVRVENGIATIEGTLTNLKAARAAAEIAKNTHGVVTVDDEVSVFNEIVISPEVNATDNEVKLAVEKAINRDPYLVSEQIEVSVNEGVVSLEGTANTYFEKYQADEVTSRVNGVISVVNNLEVGYAQLDYTPAFYDWNVIDYDFDYEPATLSDAELKRAVERELTWSPFVSKVNVNIQVDDGVVTLTGEVLNMRSVTEATEEAYEAGAAQVYNRLELI